MPERINVTIKRQLRNEKPKTLTVLSDAVACHLYQTSFISWMTF
jgi:hypothetical protein